MREEAILKALRGLLKKTTKHSNQAFRQLLRSREKRKCGLDLSRAEFSRNLAKKMELAAGAIAPRRIRGVSSS